MRPRPPDATRLLRGRDDELAVIDRLVVGAQRGESGVLVVDGPAGFGKTRLLQAGVDLARAAGLGVGFGDAEDGGQAVPMMALLSALFSGSDPLLDRARLRDLPSAPEQRFWLVQELAGLLEDAALHRPLLVCVDDLQWADSGTLAALRSLPGQLADLPIVWIAAWRLEQGSAEGRATMDQLAPESRRLTLGPLDGAAVLLVVRDVLGADPDDELLALAMRSGGNPFLLVELLHGLLDEGRVQVENGRAQVVGTQLPHRLRESMRVRLGQRSPPARELAGVAAVLGRRFSHDQLAAMVGRPAPELLRPIDELLGAGVIVEDDQRLAFGHDLIRESVLVALPVSSRRALQRRAVDVFLAEGAPPVEVARQLAQSAEPGDRQAISLLSRAAEALRLSDSSAAAELAVKALEMAAPDDAMRGPLVAQAAVLLLAAGRSSEGQALAQGALGELLPPEPQAEVCLTIAELTSIPADIRAEACRSALELLGLPERLRLRLRARLAYSLVHVGEPEDARRTLDSIEGDRSAVGDDPMTRWMVEITERALDLTEDRYGEALERSRRGRRSSAAGSPLHAINTDYVIIEALALRDDLDEALRMLGGCVTAAQRHDQIWVAGVYERQRGRLWAAAGRLEDAAAALERISAGVEPNQVANSGDASALTALGRVALHTGNHRQAELCTQIAGQAMGTLPAEPRQHAAWLLALLRMAGGDPSSARAVLTEGRDPSMSPLPRSFVDPADPPQLVRIAMACGDEELAAEAVGIAGRRSVRNPGVASLRAIAAHARGLRHRDVAELSRAVQDFAASPRRLALASATEDLGRLLVEHGPRAEGITRLGEALELYVEMGATWDATRTRRRLRRLGVRRNLRPPRPAAGWAGLTDSELAVVRLVAAGRTNREVATRLYLSPYTVNTHLRHVFTKLGIRSRVDLVRMFVSQREESPTTPGT